MGNPQNTRVHRLENSTRRTLWILFGSDTPGSDEVLRVCLGLPGTRNITAAHVAKAVPDIFLQYAEIYTAAGNQPVACL